MGTRAILLSPSKRNETGCKRKTRRLHHTPLHWRRTCGSVRVRLASLGWRTCVTGMGTRLWCSDNGSLTFFRLSFNGAGCLWQPISRWYQGSPLQSGQPPVLRSGSCRRGLSFMITGKSRTCRSDSALPNKALAVGRATSRTLLKRFVQVVISISNP